MGATLLAIRNSLCRHMLDVVPTNGKELAKDIAERIDQVAQHSITGDPKIEFVTLRTTGDPGLGYLIAPIPPSPLAPHQVTVGNDRCFMAVATPGTVGFPRRRWSDSTNDASARTSTGRGADPPQSPTGCGCLYSIARMGWRAPWPGSQLETTRGRQVDARHWAGD